MERPQISLFASSIRPHLWEAFFKSLEDTKVSVEVVFAGNIPDEIKIRSIAKCMMLEIDNASLMYIPTGNIKPAQCYEIARRQCTGELIHWTADDAEYKEGILDNAYNYWKKRGEEKLILSLQTKEHYENFNMIDMDGHRFFGWNHASPLMAPLALMSRSFLDELGGADRRYICGQYENDIVMRAMAVGGGVKIFRDGYIELDHKNKHFGEGVNQLRSFALGYPNDRKVLETSWADGKKVLTERTDKFEPFEETEDWYFKSQSNNKHIWE